MDSCQEFFIKFFIKFFFCFFRIIKETQTPFDITHDRLFRKINLYVHNLTKASRVLRLAFLHDNDAILLYLSALIPTVCTRLVLANSGASETVLKNVKLLLAYSDRPLSEISNFFFFSSQSYFQNLFKRQFGITPLAYRKRHHKE